MNRRHLLILFLVLLQHSFACLNGETKKLKNGAFIYEDHDGVIPYGHDFYIDNFPKLIRELDSLYTATRDIDYLSDKGYVLTIQGKYQQALQIYFKIEQLEPNRYSTASNVGTIYELLGDYQKALFWISKAIRLNPKSHMGSEWLHLKILEAKIGGTKYVNSNFLLNTNFGNLEEPTSTLSKAQRKALINSLYFQLNERLSFIKTEDPIIGILLFELGNLVFLEKNYHDAKQIYYKARDYGYDTLPLRERIDLASNMLLLELRKENHQLFLHNIYHQNVFVITLTLASIVICTLSITLWRLRKKYRTLSKRLVDEKSDVV